MIVLVYSREEPDRLLEFLSHEFSDYEDITICKTAEQVHHELADNRKNISKLLIEEGVIDTSVMIGECRENSPRIPVQILLKI